jgi:membrane protease YdiL (CAAX protease family)
MSFGALAKRHPLSGFLIMACVLSWWPWPLYRFAPSAVQGPVLPIGPLAAAAIMLVLVGGRPAVDSWLRAIVAWRVGIGWYALALLLPTVIAAVSVGVNLFLGADLLPSAGLPGWLELTIRFVFLFMLVGLGEEPAWRGYVLPRLIVGRTALSAALLVGLLQIVWHLPLLGIDYDVADLWPWLAALLAMSVVLTWMWLATGGNLLLPVVFHTTADTAALAWSWFGSADQIRLWWIWAGLWLAAAAIVIIANGAALHQPKPRRMMR